jgi:hypothetical protein
MVDLDKVIFFLRHRVTLYTRFENEFDYIQMEADLHDYLEHPENWRWFIHDWPNPESVPVPYLVTLNELKEEIRVVKVYKNESSYDVGFPTGVEWRNDWGRRNLPIYKKLLEG